MGCQTTRYRIQSNSCPNRTWGRSHLGIGQGKYIESLAERKKCVGRGYLLTKSGLHGSADSTLPGDMIMDVWGTRDVSRRLTTSRDWMITNLNLFSQDNAWDAVWGCLWNTIRFSTSVGQKKNLSSSQAVAPRLADFARPMLYHRRRENSWANWGLP